MTIVSDQAAFYVTGGTIPPGSPSYVARAADREQFAALERGELCYVLNARQMGKSSLSVRTRQALEAAGTRTAFLDLQKFGSSATPEQWYRGLLERIGSDLKLRPEFLVYWRDNAETPPLSRLFGALRDVALERIDGNLVVFLDEIDVTRDLRFPTDEFFGAIRETHNARVTDAAYERLTFCLIGTVAPTDLIRDVRLSPFNIGTRLKLSDLTRVEAAPLALPLPGSDKTLDRVYGWTSGHPYLTQRLCAELSRAQRLDVDAVVARLFFAKSDADVDENIKNVRNGILRAGSLGSVDASDTAANDAGFDRTDLLTRYGAIVAGKRVPDDDTDGVCAALRLSGLVTATGGFLRVRNRVYAHLFDAAWVRANLPDAEVRRQRAAVARARWQVGSIAATVLLVMAGLLWQTSEAERRANAQATRADREAAIATAQGAVTTHLAYVSMANLIDRNIDNGNYSVAQQLLHDASQLPRTERSYEWHYLQECLHPERLLLTGHTAPIEAVAFSPDGNWIATGSNDNTARIWDAATGKALLTLKGHKDAVRAVAFSPDGKCLATGSDDSTARLWDVATGKKLLTFKGHTENVASVAFSPDGKHLATGSWDTTAGLWDVATGRRLLTFKGHTNIVASVAFSPDGKCLATGSWDGTARLWDAANGKRLLALKAAPNFVYAVAWSPNGKRLATGGDKGNAYLWDAATGKERFALKGHAASVRSLTFSPSGKQIATASNDTTVRFWDAATGKETITFKGYANGAPLVAFSPDGKRMVTASNDNTARLWDAAPVRENTTIKGYPNSVNAVAFSPDSQCLATSGGDTTARLYDVATGKHLLTFKGHTGTVLSLAFSPDGKRLATGSYGMDDNAARLWDVSTGKEVVTFKGHSSRVVSVAFSPDGKRLATSNWDDTARLWDVATGKEILTFRGHTGNVQSVAFSPDGKRLATTDNDTTVRLWDVATGREMVVFRGHTLGMMAVAFSPDGKYLATGSGDQTVRIWRKPTQAQRETMDLQDAQSAAQKRP